MGRLIPRLWDGNRREALGRSRCSLRYFPSLQELGYVIKGFISSSETSWQRVPLIRAQWNIDMYLRVKHLWWSIILPLATLILFLKARCEGLTIMDSLILCLVSH